MSAEKMEKRETCYAVLLARLRQRPCADMRILWDLPLLQQGCQVLHWKSGHKIGCKRKGRVDFALFNIPRIAKS
jgi:hypothetical protein